jgi:signal transduction histidine kinase
MLEGDGGRRTARDWVVDVVMFFVALGLGGAVLTDTWPNHAGWTRALDIVVGIAACLALWVRRTHPVGVAVSTVVASMFFALAAGAGLMALFNAAIRAPRRALLGITALALAGSAVFPALYRGDRSYDWLELFLGVLLTVVVIGWGLFVRAQRELMAALRGRATQLEAEQQLSAERARDAERRRIAREMHDVLAHRLSLLSVHAGALEFRPDASPEEVSEAAAVIRATARAALEELREVIGVLRDDVDGEAPQPPQPTFAQIPALIEESRAAGMNVGLRDETRDGEDVPVGVGRTAYRVVQEGLTNARRHAPGAAVDVIVSGAPASPLVVRIASRPPVGVAARSEPRPTGTGSGLVGLGERVELAGGELKFGTDDTGDFVLIAALPWPS